MRRTLGITLGLLVILLVELKFLPSRLLATALTTTGFVGILITLVISTTFWRREARDVGTSHASVGPRGTYLMVAILLEIAFVNTCIFAFPRQSEHILLPGAFLLLAVVFWQGARLYRH